IRQQQARAAALAQVQQIEQTLAPLAVAVAHPKSTGAGDDDKARLIRNSTYLVDNHRVAEFRTAVQQCAEANPGLRLRLTGPRPAYGVIPEESPCTVRASCRPRSGRWRATRSTRTRPGCWRKNRWRWWICSTGSSPREWC